MRIEKPLLLVLDDTLDLSDVSDEFQVVRGESDKLGAEILGVDCVLVGIDGDGDLETMQALRGVFPGVIVARCQANQVHPAITAGADEFVNHAASRFEILFRIRRALSGDPYRRRLGLRPWSAIAEYVARDLARSDRYDRHVALLFVIIRGERPERTDDAQVCKDVLADAVRESDVIGLYDHGEFVIVVDEADNEIAQSLGLRILRNAKNRGLDLAIGLACSRAVDVDSPTDLLRLAASAAERADANQLEVVSANR